MLIITSVLTFFFHTVFSISKYFHLLEYVQVPFENILSEMSVMKFFVSLFFACLTASFVYFFIKNREINKKQQQVIEAMSLNTDKIVHRFEDFANLLPEGLYETDTTGTITFVTDNLSNLVGLKSEEIIGKNILSFAAVSSIEKAKREFAKRIDNIPSNGLNEYDILTKTGETKSVVLHAIPKVDVTGNVVGTRGIIMDVTEVNKLKQDYKKSYNMLSLLVDTVPVAIFFQNIKGEIVNFNNAFIAFCQKKHEDEIRNKTVFDIFPHTIARLLYKKTADFMRTRDTQQDFYIHHNNVEAFVSQAKFINEENKYDSGIISVIQDLSSINTIKDKLSISEETFKVLTERSILGVFIMRGENALYMNNKVMEIVGYHKDEVVLNNDFFPKIIYDKDLEKFTTMFDVLNKTGKVSGSLRVRSKAGIIKYIEVDAKTINYEGSPSVLCTILDITPYINAIKKKYNINS